MVKVVVAGGGGSVAREIIEGILAKKKHRVTVLTRHDVTDPHADGISWIKADYHDKKALVELLRGADVVLSFVLPGLDPGNIAQRNLIDACIEAGVKRFAPSEWAASSNSGLSAYAGKDEVREYLEAVNQQNKVLEYCLFQPGLFTNYFTYPHMSGKHLAMISTLYADFENRQAILIDDGDQPCTHTLVQDFAGVVAEALDYPHEWPVIGGVRGWQTTPADLVKLGEKLRGGPFTIHGISSADLETQGLQTAWVPVFEHHALPKSEEISKIVSTDILRGIPRGAWSVSDEWNKLLPSFKFTDPEEFLRSHWKGME